MNIIFFRQYFVQHSNSLSSSLFVSTFLVFLLSRPLLSLSLSPSNLIDYDVSVFAQALQSNQFVEEHSGSAVGDFSVIRYIALHTDLGLWMSSS